MMTHWKSIVFVVGVLGAWACTGATPSVAVADTSKAEMQEQYGPVLKLEGKARK